MTESFAVVVPWFNPDQLAAFKEAWNLDGAIPSWLIFQQDENREGCAVTKNRGMFRAMDQGVEVVVILDDDCFPASGELRDDCPWLLEQFALDHVRALKPQQVEMFEVVTDPPSRGTPYGSLTMTMPVAASMGFWTGVGDYDAVRQLATNVAPMEFSQKAIHGKYFPLSGMNLAFRPKDWLPWCKFIDVPRFDDIWMGFLWQFHAYARGFCFNLGGPLVRHARQSDPWKNLRVESQYLEQNETLWQKIASHPQASYEEMLALLPPHEGGSDR